MKKLLIVTPAVLAAVLGTAGHAAAAPSGPDVPQVVEELEAQGYNVQLNGTAGGQVADCSVSDVRGIGADNNLGTVYVDLDCTHAYLTD
ncbi:hypothetical protein BVC93_04450 [Mycobacterium sp. MS1601]|uniref:hypothetical protein n=1 Tax=Mycobacterium sp. MS1601 TaxID=1936029 RepID=UPI00097918B3|nr:hypothetical protein [Mycobacterium sp. MS1601]AQA01812.1 hypothetical protein BVC93_04450 [Mycobacterium sp. MS1601]